MSSFDPGFRDYTIEQALKLASAGSKPNALFVDVGAALGSVTKQLQQSNPAARTVAFEPWSGNLEHFYKHTTGIDNVALLPVAVADFNGPGVLYVRKVVEGNEADRWASLKGYSSTGRLVPASEVQDLPKVGQTTEVSVCRLDTIFSEPISLLKIDTQGGELGVLKGCERLFRENLVDMLLVEWSGERDVLAFAREHGFTPFDTLYNAIPFDGEPEGKGFGENPKVYDLSNGSIAVRGTIADMPLEDDAVCSFVEEFQAEKGHMWTDVLFVAPWALERFG
jgi:FkbM family methyltransferase